MYKTYGKTTTFSTNLDFMTTAQKISYLLWQNKDIFILSFMRSDKKIALAWYIDKDSQ